MKTAKALMVQGCSSNAGKSYLVAGLCRLYADRGLKVAPFKAQNMSNNAGVTPNGLEMGRAQLLQAQAARVTPDVRMNPVLIKPEGETRSQVVVLGKPDLALSTLPWTRRKAHLWERVKASLHSLMADYDLVVIEGAGSPAEVNLKAGDIVNMRVAKEARAPVLLVADIDRGGAFAHLLGTWHCLEADERALLAGFVLNKFRGDATLLESGIRWLEAQTGVPTVGVVPYLKLPLPDEDAFSLDPSPRQEGDVIAIVRLPMLANFDEFDPLVHEAAVTVRWAERPDDLRGARAVILPGSKHVAHDLAWLYRTSCADEILRLAESGVPILGICGGLQMLGRVLRDPHGIEGGGEAAGLGLLDVESELALEKTTRLAEATLVESGERVRGYEIHHGQTRAGPQAEPYLSDGLGYRQGNVVGVYLHGLFEDAAFRRRFLASLGLFAREGDWQDEVERALDRLAAHLNAHLDLAAIDKACFAQATETLAATAPSDRERPSPLGPSAALILITGGARSGKSRYAEALARHLGGEDVGYVATLEPGDDEMQRRIARHRQRRPASWRTIEAPLTVAAVLREATESVLLLDCLSGFVSNILLAHEHEGEEAAIAAVLGEVARVLEAVQACGKTVIVVSNEVGSGVVPPTALGRWYRDALGLANQRVAQAADAVALVTVGIPQVLKGTLPGVKDVERHRKGQNDGAIPPEARSRAS